MRTAAGLICCSLAGCAAGGTVPLDDGQTLPMGVDRVANPEPRAVRPWYFVDAPATASTSSAPATAPARPGCARIVALMSGPEKPPHPECSLENAVKGVHDGDAMQCGALTVCPEPEAVEYSRQCVADSIAFHRPFVVSWEEPSTDSFAKVALVGQRDKGRFAVFRVNYNGCPMGCGNGDPHTTTHRCSRLIQMRDQCRKGRPIRAERGKVDLGGLCALTPHEQEQLSLGAVFYCDSPTKISSCP